MHRRIVFTTLVLNQYREEFFNRVRDELSKHEIDFVLLYSKSDDDAVKGKKDEIDIPWGRVIETKNIKLGGFTLYWQKCLPFLKNADLIILQQENKILVSYYLMFLRRLYGVRMAFWGHGTNRQKPKESMENKFKRLVVNRCDWWFAYTDGVKNFLAEGGFPAEKISVNHNSINTSALVTAYDTISDNTVEAVRKSLGFDSDNIAIFCGSIYKEKQIDFLIEAATLIKQQVPDFHLVVVGAGAETDKIKAAAEKHAFIHYVGPKFNDEKIAYFKLAKVHLMPGLVGLAVLDSFALKTPMLTTTYPFHSPEIDYLKDGYNGLVTPFEVNAYANGVIDLFKHPKKLDTLVAGCEASRGTYTIERMAKSFSEGVLQFYKTYFPKAT